MMVTWLLIGIIAALGLILLWLWFNRPKAVGSPADLPSLQNELRQMREDLRALLGGQGESQGRERSLETSVRQLLERLERLRAQWEEDRREKDKKAEAQTELVRKVAGVLLGSKSAGLLGENIVAEQMKKLLPNWIVTNFKLGNQTVEFALKLFDGRIIPIDSKVVAVDKLRRLSETTDEEAKKKLAQEINRDLEKKVKEVARYLDPPRTYHKAIMAVPEAAYELLDLKVQEAAFRSNLYLTPYSMLAPLLLTILEIERKSQATLSQQQVEAFLSNLRKDLYELRGLLDDSVAKGSKMISNAYDKSTLLVERILSRLAALEASEKEIEELEKVI